jgi:hypothetical protein
MKDLNIRVDTAKFLEKYLGKTSSTFVFTIFYGYDPKRTGDKK